jgi:hypothetical protein
VNLEQRRKLATLLIGKQATSDLNLAPGSEKLRGIIKHDGAAMSGKSVTGKCRYESICYTPQAGV